MREFVIVHNIPSPYRVHLFAQLAHQLSLRDIRLHVHFMARGHSDRPKDWRSGARAIPFAHSFWWDCGPRVRRKKWHFNPGLLARLAVRRPDYLMVCGPWDSITGVVASLVGRGCVMVCWAEGNTYSPGVVNGPVAWAKRSLVDRFNVFAVPGIEGESYARLLMGRGDRCPRLVRLPNIVDERRFKIALESDTSVLSHMRHRLGITGDERIALWPARLSPEKGIIETLRMLDPNVLRGWKIVLVGDGPLQAEICQVIESEGLRAHFLMHSSIPYDDMPAAYACADLFMLPSLRDLNPLSVVEALHSGLPILVSNKVGNSREALIDGHNGWAISHGDPAQSKVSLEKAFGSDRGILRRMGMVSKGIASRGWDSKNAIEQFLDSIPVER